MDMSPEYRALVFEPSFQSLAKLGFKPGVFVHAAEPTQYFQEVLAIAVTSQPDKFWLEIAEYPMLKQEADLKWRYASSLQKAVRRGFRKEAQQAAYALFHVDQAYFWRRLAVIAVEDVGTGNPVAVVLTMAACKSKKYRDSVGALKVALYLTDMLTTGLKDRLSCIFDGYVATAPEGNKDREEVRSIGRKGGAGALEKLYANPGESILRRGFAANLLSSGGAPGRIAIMSSQDAIAPKMITWAAATYCPLARDPMWQAYPLIWESAQKAATQLHVIEEKLTPEILHGVLYQTFDVYTREGTRVMAYFNKACEELAKFYEARPDLDKVKITGRIVFNLDGGLLDRSLMWNEAMQIYRGFLEGTFGSQHLAWDELQQLADIVFRNMPLLKKARERVVIK